MSVSAILGQKSREVFSIEPQVKLCDCIKKLNDKRVGALLVIDKKGTLEGIISERDILRKAFDTKGKMCDSPVNATMTPKSKLITARKDSTIKEVMQTMTTNRIRHLPIMDGEKVLGIVSIGDVIKGLLDEVIAENEQIKDYILGKYA
jgi:CBS domain-containing protein